MNMIQSGIQLSSLGQNRDPMPATKLHDLNDRKQLELMERTGYEIVQRNGMYSTAVKAHSHIAIVVTPPSLKSFANQKNLSNHRVVIRKNPLQITSDHFRMTTL